MSNQETHEPTPSPMVISVPEGETLTLSASRGGKITIVATLATCREIDQVELDHSLGTAPKQSADGGPDSIRREPPNGG